jgi:hypothetical protein
LVYGLILGFGVSVLLTLILFIFKIKIIILHVLVFIGLFIGGVLIAYFMHFRVTEKEIARQLDKIGLDQRVITMLEYQEDDSVLARLQREDAISKLNSLDVKSVKISFKRISIIILGICFVLYVGAFFLPKHVDNQIPEEPPIVEDEPSEEDKIIAEMIQKIRQIIDDAEVEDELKVKLHELVDQLEIDLVACETVDEKITLIKQAMKKIQDIIDYYLTERNMGQALQMYDPFTGKDFLTGALGEAVYDKNLEGVDTSLEEFKAAMLAASLMRSMTFDELKNEYVSNLDEALKRATLEENEALIAAIANFKDNLKSATKDNIAEIIDVAKEEIKKALLEDPTGTKDPQAAEDMKEEIQDAMQDALDQLEQEKEEQEDEIESEGESEENESDTPSIPDNPLESEPIIDGNTPYLEEYDKYADIIKELLSSYEGQEIPEDVRKIIEEYLKLLQ